MVVWFHQIILGEVITLLLSHSPSNNPQLDISFHVHKESPGDSNREYTITFWRPLTWTCLPFFSPLWHKSYQISNTWSSISGISPVAGWADPIDSKYTQNKSFFHNPGSLALISHASDIPYSSHWTALKATLDHLRMCPDWVDWNCLAEYYRSSPSIPSHDHPGQRTFCQDGRLFRRLKWFLWRRKPSSILAADIPCSWVSSSLWTCQTCRGAWEMDPSQTR